MLGGVSWKEFAIDLRTEIDEDNMFNGAAALAFYLTLAIFPALILVISVLPYIPIENVDQAILNLLRQALPQEAGGLVTSVVSNVTSQRRGGLLSFSAIATLWAASSGMYGVMRQLNITYDAVEQRSFVRGRLTAIALSLVFGVLVIGALSLVVLGGVIQDWIGERWGFSSALLICFAVLRWIIIICALLFGLALMYRLGPNLDHRVELVTPGSVVGVALLITASLGFAVYTRNFGNYDAIYGSIGAVIILMLWLYIAALVLLLGAEVNALVERYRSVESADGDASERHAGRDDGRSESDGRVS